MLGSHVQAHPCFTLYFDRFPLTGPPSWLSVVVSAYQNTFHRVCTRSDMIRVYRSLTRMRASSAPKKKHNFVVPWHEFCSGFWKSMFWCSLPSVPRFANLKVLSSFTSWFWWPVTTGWWHAKNGHSFGMRMNFLTFLLSCVTLAEILHMEHLGRRLGRIHIVNGLLKWTLHTLHVKWMRIILVQGVGAPELPWDRHFAGEGKTTLHTVFAVSIRISAALESLEVWRLGDRGPFIDSTLTERNWYLRRPFWFAWRGPSWQTLALAGFHLPSRISPHWLGVSGRRLRGRFERPGHLEFRTICSRMCRAPCASSARQVQFGLVTSKVLVSCSPEAISALACCALETELKSKCCFHSQPQTSLPQVFLCGCHTTSWSCSRGMPTSRHWTSLNTWINNSRNSAKWWWQVYAWFYLTVSHAYFAFSFSCKACLHGGLLCHHQWAGDLVCFQSDLCAAGHCFHGVPWIHYDPAWLIVPASTVAFIPFRVLWVGKEPKGTISKTTHLRTM